MTHVLGIAGGPGAGKSTLAARIAAEADGRAVVVPADGFHLPNRVLAERGLASRKGAPDTFDVEGLATLLAAVRDAGRGDLAAPAYSRELHEPVAGAIAIPAGIPTVIVEGNYLGLSASGWERVRPLVDELWFLDVPWDVARERLIRRRLAAGRDHTDAQQWVDTVDAANHALIAPTRRAADRIIPYP